MAQIKCDVCDEEFDTENQLMQHKAQMHAGQADTTSAGEDRMGGDTLERDNDSDLEEPDLPRAANE
jgi:hypothetical protein